MARVTVGGWRQVRSALALSAVIAVAGTVVSGTAGALLAADQSDAMASAMDRRAALLQQGVTAQTGRYVDTLAAVAGAVGAFDRLTADKFAQAAQPLRQMQLAGATSIAYLVPAAETQVAEVQRFWRSRGADNLVLDPHDGVEEHLFSIFSQPLHWSPPAPTGVDVAQAAAPVRSLVEARRSGQVSVSEPYQLIGDENLPVAQRQMSFTLSAPVLGPVAASGQRPFQGWVVMDLRGQDFMGATLDRSSQGIVDVILHASSATGTLTRVAALHSTTGGVRDLHRRVEIQVGQRRWQLTIEATAATMPGASRQPAMMTGAGLLLTALLAALVFTLATGGDRARERVRAATADLLASEIRLRQEKADLRAFAGVVAHDLQAPLAGVVGYAEMLTDELDDGTTDAAVLRPMLHRVTAGAGRMSQLINDLLAYATARDAAIQLTDLDLRELVDEAVIAHLDAEGIAGRPIPTIYVGSLPPVHADLIMVRQLLHNLIRNAIKYTPPGETPRVDITAHDPGSGRVELQVADRGIGIPAGQHEAVFGSFHRRQAGADAPTAGLGLAICHRVVERHGGAITASDNPGGGARITLTLAATRPAPADVPTPPAIPGYQTSLR